jgi:hypothetical protein
VINCSTSHNRSLRTKLKGTFFRKRPSVVAGPLVETLHYCHGNFGPREGTKLIVFEEVPAKALRGFSRFVNSNALLSLITAGSVADFMN